MTEQEMGKCIRSFCWMLIVAAILMVASEKINTYQAEKGIAISRFLKRQYQIEISPENAKYIDCRMYLD
jgi:hypothetical protein